MSGIHHYKLARLHAGEGNHQHRIRKREGERRKKERKRERETVYFEERPLHEPPWMQYVYP